MYEVANTQHNGYTEHLQEPNHTNPTPPTAITCTHVGGILVIIDPLDMIDGE